MTNLKIVIASDHAGYDLKSAIIKEFKSKFDLIDLGPNSADVSVDYPDFAKKLAKEIINKKAAKETIFGILVCGSGVGISIAANRFPEIRAALCHNQKIAKLSRKHNDANVLCLGSRITKTDSALKIVKAFLSTKFEGGRHIKRVEKLGKL